MTTVNVAQSEKQLKRARKALYAQCEAAGITLKAIAEEARCSKSYVVHYFKGRRSPRAVELAIEKLLLLAAQHGQRRSA